MTDKIDVLQIELEGYIYKKSRCPVEIVHGVDLPLAIKIFWKIIIKFNEVRSKISALLRLNAYCCGIKSAFYMFNIYYHCSWLWIVWLKHPIPLKTQWFHVQVVPIAVVDERLH